MDVAYFFNEIVNVARYSEIDRVVRRGSWGQAKAAFARMVRDTLQPDKHYAAAPLIIRRAFFLPDESMEAAADRIAGGLLVSTGTPCAFPGEVDWLADPTVNQYKEWTWQLNRHHDWQILAERYRRTKEERYAEAFVRLFRSWIRQAGHLGRDQAVDAMCWRTIEAGIRMKDTWPYAIHAFAFSSAMTDDDILDWCMAVWRHGRLLRHEHKEANWLIMEMNGLAQIGLLYPFFRESEEWLAYALDQLSMEMTRQVYPDGFQFELSTGYHQVILTNYFHLAKACELYGHPRPHALTERLELAYEVNLKLMMPDGRLPDLNDGNRAPVAPLMKTGVELFPDRSDFLWAHSEGMAGKPPSEASVALPYAGYYVMRSGWGKEDLWLLFDAGPYGRSHQHEDKLNLLLYAYGSRLLTEAGNYAYDDSEMRRYVLSTRSHNTARVDGLDQNRGYQYAWKPDDLNRQSDAVWKSSSRMDAAEGSYTEGYGSQCEVKVTHHRKVVFMKGVPAVISPFVLVIDHFVPSDDKEHHYDILWHPDTETVRIGRDRTVYGDNPSRAGIVIMTSSDTDPCIQAVSAQRSPEWQGWTTTGNGHQGEYTASPAIAFQYETKGEAVYPTLLYPTRPHERCPVKSFVLAIEHNGQLTITISLKDDTVLSLPLYTQD